MSMLKVFKFNVLLKRFIVLCYSLIITWGVLFIWNKHVVIKADNFGITGDAYYCEFIPVVGGFLGHKSNLNIEYNLQDVKGISASYIHRYIIKDLAYIYKGNPHRYNKALDIAGPPGQEIVWAFWGYNYTRHPIQLYKIIMPLSNTQNDLTRLLDFSGNSNVAIKRKEVTYTVLHKEYKRKGKYLIYSLPKQFEPNKFYKGSVIARSKIKAPVTVIHRETTCDLREDGRQVVHNTLCLQNSEPHRQIIQANGDTIELPAGGTRCVTLSRPVNKGIKFISGENINVKILNSYKQCVNVTSAGLDPTPLGKNIFVLRDDSSYNQIWKGIQPGFGVPRPENGKVLCVTRIPYGFTSTMGKCSFVTKLDISFNTLSCLKTYKWEDLTVFIKNRGIEQENLELKIYFTDTNGNKLDDIGYFLYANKIYKDMLITKIEKIKALSSSNLSIPTLLTLHGSKIPDLYLKVVLVSDVTQEVASAAVPVCSVNPIGSLNLSGCTEGNTLEYSYVAKLDFNQGFLTRLKNFNFKLVLSSNIETFESDVKRGYFVLHGGIRVPLECLGQNSVWQCKTFSNNNDFVKVKQIVLHGNLRSMQATQVEVLSIRAKVFLQGFTAEANTQAGVSRCSNITQVYPKVTPVTPPPGEPGKSSSIVRHTSGKNYLVMYIDLDTNRVVGKDLQDKRANYSKQIRVHGVGKMRDVRRPRTHYYRLFWGSVILFMLLWVSISLLVVVLYVAYIIGTTIVTLIKRIILLRYNSISFYKQRLRK